jgi:hypothetical protein
MSFNYGLRPGTIQKITMAGSSVASIASSAFGSQTEYVRIASSADFHIIFGGSPTATASHIFIPADQPEIFKVSPGEKVAALGGVSAVISIVEMGG